MPQRTGRFQQADRLRRSIEFQQVVRRGRRAAGTAFVVVVSERARSRAGPVRGSRLGVTVSRKVGRAVVRNRVKRRIREWFRVRRASLGADLDWVVIGRAAAAGLTREAAEEELSRLSQVATRLGAPDGAA